MRFLYGDTTPFPLATNFLDTFSAVVDACVALLKIDEELDDLGVQEKDTKAAAEDAQRRIALIQQSLERAAAQSSEVAAEVIQEARAALERAATHVAENRERLLREFRTAAARLRTGLGVALEELFRRHDLPDMSWSLEWRAATHGRPAHAMASGQALCGLAVKIELDTSGFAAPIRVRDLGEDVAIRMPRPARWWRRAGEQRIRLGACLITEVERSPARETMLLRQSTRPGAAGFAVTVRCDVCASPTVQRLGARDSVILDSEDALAVRRLWRRITAYLGGIEAGRRRLAAATYGVAPAAEVRRPARLAEAILVSIANLVTEIRERSRVPGEYVLKRELRAGVREELYLRREDLEEKLATLGVERQTYFERLGLLQQRVIYMDAMSPTPLDWATPAKA